MSKSKLCYILPFLDGKISVLKERTSEIAKEIEIKKEKIARLENEPSS